MQDKRWRHIASRWMQVLTYALIGAFTFEVALALVWKRSDVLLSFPPILVAATSWLVAALVVYVVAEPIRIRRRQWARVLAYPPIWVSVLLALVMAAWLEAPLIHSRGGAPPYWTDDFVLLSIASALMLPVVIHNSGRRKAQPIPRHQGAGGLEWHVIERWLACGEEPLTAPQRDLFGHSVLADRLARLIREHRRSVALLGPWGSGKTGLLNLAEAALQSDGKTTTLVARLDVWAVPDAKDVPRLALSKIVQSLDDMCDAIAFRGIPLSYQRLAAAELTGNLSRFFSVGEGASDSLDEIERLSPLLSAIDAQVILVVEDLDRAGDEFDTRHLERLLWTLRRLPRVKFVVALDHTRSAFDFSKVCDVTILMPPMEHAQLREIVSTAYEHWRVAYADIDPKPENARDRFRLDEAAGGGLLEYWRRTGRDTPLDALLETLATPRALKHVLSQVDRVWRQLHGEVDLDDLIVVAALRHAAEPVYRFLLANIDAARHEVDEMMPRTQRVRPEWDQLMGRIDSSGAVQRLVDLLQIEQLQTPHGGTRNKDLPQGVHLAEPVDYFRKIVAEQVAVGELRDQAVLRNIRDWRSGTSDALVTMLARATDPEGYVDRWEHYSDRHTDDELRRLVEEVETILLSRDGNQANASDTAIIALWRRCNRRLRRGAHDIWLTERLAQAAATSLFFAERFLYYWTGDRGLVNDDGLLTIKSNLVAAIEANAPTPDRLLRIATQSEPFLFARLTHHLREVNRWRDYLAPLLLEAARTYPEQFLPQIANLIGTSESSILPSSSPSDSAKFINAYEIDRRKAQQLFAGRIREALGLLREYAGNNQHVTRAMTAADAWLSELDPPKLPC